jgi:hypothetical protein
MSRRILYPSKIRLKIKLNKQLEATEIIAELKIEDKLTNIFQLIFK